MNPAQAREALEEDLNYVFVDPLLLQAALTHPTWTNEHPGGGEHYERLEFLGDAALGLLVSRMLLTDHPAEQEGALSRRRAQIVRKETLNGLARRWGWERYVQLGQGQKGSGVADTILADVLEAVMGAVFYDGGYERLEQCFSARLKEGLLALLGQADHRDDKTQLQELCHRLRLPQPLYTIVAADGPAHARLFRVRVEISGTGGIAGIEAVGSSKKRAEQLCAAQAYARLRAP